MVTVAGIALGIAFFSSVQASRVLNPAQDAFESQRLQWLAATSLLMCLVGVTNSMLMSVTERYREIGTIKCLGASDGFIVKVFFLESLLLGALGSLAGAVVGSLTMAFVEGFKLGPLLQVIALGTDIGLTMTVIAAIAPAVQAAKMAPAAALRVEV
jgi:ABC-type antimicrobial peptide transport system permease subunit